MGAAWGKVGEVIVILIKQEEVSQHPFVFMFGMLTAEDYLHTR